MKNIIIDGVIHAIVVRSDYKNKGVKFFTPDSFSQQLGYMHHPAGKVIKAHVHNAVSREITYTQEVLIIRKGKIRVDLYSQNREYRESVILSSGDIILLANGGHGFKILEEVEMIEIKQGPYVGEADKTHFEQPDVNAIKIIN